MLFKQLDSQRWISVVGAIAAGACVAALAVIVPMVRADDSAKPSIKDIMKRDHKGDNSVAKRVAAGKATPDEISKLLADYKIMAGEAPDMGSKDDWQQRTKKLIAATEAVQSGDQTGVAQFKAAVNCKACHELHKPKN